MPLHPEIARVIAESPVPPEGPPDPAALRAAEAARVPPVEERLPLHAVEDMVAPTAAGAVPIRIYTPDEAVSYGILVYLHGGAFFLGSLDTHDHIARELAKETGYRVVSVGYRRAPEAAYPAGLRDCYGVVRWIADNAARLRWNGIALGLAGDSSGGGMVASVTALAHDDGFGGITRQILFYPSLDLDFDPERYRSMRENARGYGLETAALKPFNSFYTGSGADPADPLVSPIARADLTGLPPALIVTAEFDPMRDEGELYGARLRQAGVPVTVVRYPGANHGFVQNFSWLPEYRTVYREAAAFLERGDIR
ncbi:alpha/beta hydrolase [Nocardia sp. NPDC003345]